MPRAVDIGYAPVIGVLLGPVDESLEHAAVMAATAKAPASALRRAIDA